MLLGEVAVLEPLGRLIEERLEIVGVEVLGQFTQRTVIRLEFFLQCGRARLVFIAGFGRIDEGGERLVGLRQLLARVLDDVGRLGAAARHARAGARQVDARVHQSLGGFIDLVDLLERDVRQIADIVMSGGQRPETKPFRDDLEKTEHDQNDQQAGGNTRFFKHIDDSS